MTESGFGAMIRSTMMAMTAMEVFHGQTGLHQLEYAELFEHGERTKAAL